VDNFAQLEQLLTGRSPGRIAVAAAHDSHVLESVHDVWQKGYASPILIGDKEKIFAIADELQIDVSHMTIIKELEDRRAAEMAIIENIQRQDLNVIEEAEGYRTLAETFTLTQQEVADRVGKARASVANALRLLELPDEVKQLVGSGLLSTGHAKVLLGLTDITEQTLLGRKCVTEELTVRTLEKLIQRRKADAAGLESRRPGKPDLPESYVRDLTDRLHKHFGTAVRLAPGVTHANGKHTKGVLEIDFYDNDDLDRLLNLLGITLD